MPVSVTLAAYNEGQTIGRTLRSVLASTYPLAEVIVVNDGSSDRTSEEVREIARHDPRIYLIEQQNTGEAGALNAGLSHASGEIIVTLDADTILTAETIGRLVRHLAADESGRLGAVAGVVRVGNRRRNLLTRWQAFGIPHPDRCGTRRPRRHGRHQYRPGSLRGMAKNRHPKGGRLHRRHTC
jgi:glycosyltransferase involved in cell wall biosynthesis